MKKIIFLCSFLAGASAAFSQTLITYGNNKVSTSEFLRAYNKNKVPITNKEKAIREYIDLYINFKLKVQAANELRLDTLSQIQTDIQNFRVQVEDNYMSDEKGKELLVNEAVQRSLKDIHIVHFSVPIADNASPADTMKAFSSANTLYDELKKGTTDYKEAVQRVSAISPVRYSDVGYITVFTLPYQFENIIYALKPGEVSKPYRTKSNWHMFKAVDIRPAAGKWRVAQILFSVPPTATESVRQEIKMHADSIHNLLLSGADFSTMAKKYSEDKLTFQLGGELPEFGTGKFDPMFEKEVLQLKTDGSISKPFLSPFGYHIVKRLGHTSAVKNAADPSLLFEMRQKVMKDARIESSKQKFSKDIVQKIGMKRTSDVKDAELLRFADTILKNPSSAIVDQFPISKKVIYKFNKGTLKGVDWLLYVAEYKNSANYKGETAKELWEKYQVYAANRYYKDHMEDYNDEFKYQMTEFKEGNMLFEVMERNVWGQASTDSLGLVKYYQANKAKYVWPPSAEVLIFSAADEKTATEILEILKKGREWRQVADAYSSAVQADSGRYELAQLPGSLVKVNPESYSPVVTNPDGTATLIKFVRAYPGGEPRTFEEAKGLVINDYQNVLEERWLSTLKKKYPVKVNDSALQALLK